MHKGIDPSMSVNKNVTVPVGNGILSTAAPIHARFDNRSEVRDAATSTLSLNGAKNEQLVLESLRWEALRTTRSS